MPVNPAVVFSGDWVRELYCFGDNTYAYKQVCKNMVEITIEQCNRYINTHNNNV